MTNELKDLIKEKLLKISEEEVGLYVIEKALDYDCLFAIMWPEFDKEFDLSSKLKTAKTKKSFKYEEIIGMLVSSFKERKDQGVDQFILSYFMLLKQEASKKISTLIGEFLDEFIQEVYNVSVLDSKEEKGSFFENLSEMSEAEEIPYYEQLTPVYEEIMTTLFSEKSHVPIIYTTQDKLRSAIFAHIAHKFSDFDAPVTINTSTIYHLSAKSVLSSLLTAPSNLMDAIDIDLDEISKKGNGGVIIIDEVDAFFDSGENILLRRIYNSCRARNLYLILGSNKKPSGEFWMEPISISFDVDVDDVVCGYMRHMSHNFNLSVKQDALDLFHKISGTLFSKKDFNSIVRLIEKSAAEASYSVFKPNQKIGDAKRELARLVDSTKKPSKSFNTQVDAILAKINFELDSQLNDKNKDLAINKEHVNRALSKFFGIKEEDMSPVEERMLKLEDRLNEEILGQEEAVKLISDSLMRSFSGLFEKSGPVGVFCVLGSSGVGKTFTAKVLQKAIYGERDLIRLDMNEYLDKTSVNKLLGTGSGYVGYEEGSAFFESIKKNPRSVVLIDEIEKASPEVIDAFLNIFDEGRAKDNKGEDVDFSQVIFIITGNIGTKSLQAASKRSMGFVQDSLQDEDDDKLANAKNELKSFFRPEFLNRIDEIIYYKPLRENTISKILNKKVQKLISNFEKRDVKISFEASVVETLTKKCIDPVHNGARLVDKVFRDNIETPAAKEFFAGKKNISVSGENGAVKFLENV